jgi:outer membrane protein assembly factor BamB
MRAVIATLGALGMLLAAAPAVAQLPGVPLPPIGPPGGSPPPEQPPPPPENQPPSAQPPGSPPTGSVTDAVDPAHTGFVDDPNLVPPLHRRWTRTFANDVQGVRSAEGKLFTRQYKNGTTTLLALDPLTGRDVWAHQIPVSGDLAYDGGLLFLPGVDGVLRAYSPADGALVWASRLHPDFQLAQLYGPPVATGGVVYVNDNGILTAVRASDGAVLWSFGSGGEPAVDAERVYFSTGCDEVYAIARSDGHQLWQHAGCSGGVGDVGPSVFAARVYVPDTANVLDAATGAELGKSPIGFPWTPVFGRGLGMFRSGGIVTAVDVASGKTRWKRKVERIDQYSSSVKLALSPVAVGYAVYGATTKGDAYALDMSTGARIWHDRVPYLSGVSSHYNGEMDVAPGLLLVPGGRKLTAYESLYRPAARGIAAGPVLTDVEFLAANTVDGVVGSELRTEGARVTLEWDEPPYRGFRRLVRGRVGPDGYFSFRIRTEMNTRVRIRRGKTESRARTIYTYPRVRYKVHRLSPNRIRVAITTRTAPQAHLGGHAATLYIGRIKAHRLDRLGTARLSGRGRGRAGTSVVFPALRRLGDHDYFAVCVKGQLRFDLGRASRFTRSCGARRIRF